MLLLSRMPILPLTPMPGLGLVLFGASTLSLMLLLALMLVLSRMPTLSGTSVLFPTPTLGRLLRHGVF
jgi:hypothetical protein